MKKVFCLALALFVIIACENKKVLSADPNDGVDFSTLQGSETNDFTDVNLSELAKE